jgi:hypothetical protein
VKRDHRKSPLPKSQEAGSGSLKLREELKIEGSAVAGSRHAKRAKGGPGKVPIAGGDAAGVKTAHSGRRQDSNPRREATQAENRQKLPLDERFASGNLEVIHAT